LRQSIAIGSESRPPQPGTGIFRSPLPSGTTVTEAKAIKAERDVRRNKGEYVVVAKKVRFSQAGEEWHAQVTYRPDWKADTGRYLRGRLKDSWGNRPVASISPADCLALMSKFQAEGLGQSLIANHIKVARSVFGFCVLKGYIAASPFDSIPRGKLPNCAVTREHREWTDDDVRKLIAAAYALDERDAARTNCYGLLTETLITCGPRLGEALA